MLKMMNPMGSMPSVPGVGDDKKDDDGMTREEQQEQEKLRQDAIKMAERQRHNKYKKQEDEREVIRQGIRDKYKIEKPANEDEEEEEDEDEDGFGASRRKEEEDDDDPVIQAQKLAEKHMNDAKKMAEEKCVLQ